MVFPSIIKKSTVTKKLIFFISLKNIILNPIFSLNNLNPFSCKVMVTEKIGNSILIYARFSSGKNTLLFSQGSLLKILPEIFFPNKFISKKCF